MTIRVAKGLKEESEVKLMEVDCVREQSLEKTEKTGRESLVHYSLAKCGTAASFPVITGILVIAQS